MNLSDVSTVLTAKSGSEQTSSLSLNRVQRSQFPALPVVVPAAVYAATPAGSRSWDAVWFIPPLGSFQELFVLAVGQDDGYRFLVVLDDDLRFIFVYALHKRQELITRFRDR